MSCDVYITILTCLNKEKSEFEQCLDTLEKHNKQAVMTINSIKCKLIALEESIKFIESIGFER